jgi:hypothetical protein
MNNEAYGHRCNVNRNTKRGYSSHLPKVGCPVAPSQSTNDEEVNRRNSTVIGGQKDLVITSGF